MAPGKEHKTAFRCRYGLFEYNVMFFDLCNVPDSFQEFMNEILHEFVDDFVIIYSKNQREYHHHVHLVLEQLHAIEIHFKSSKCIFDAKEINFLDYVINEKEVSMNFFKVD